MVGWGLQEWEVDSFPEQKYKIKNIWPYYEHIYKNTWI